MKKQVLIFATFITSIGIYSQNTFPVSGNSGVGTASPTVPFEIGNTLSQGSTIFRFSNPQQNNQILFRDRDISTFMYGIQSNQIKVGATGFDHKIMSIQSNANNITLWPTFSVNSSSNIIINPTGNVGINQASPAFKLDVNGAVNASNYYINGSPISCLTGLWLTSPSNTNNIYYNAGNVGIGTNNPTVPFQIATTLTQGATIFNFGNPQQNNQIIFRDRDISTFMYGMQASQIKVGASGADHKIMSIQANSQNIEVWPTVAINSPNNILINAGQNVGVGNANPQYKLDVTGTVNATQFLVNGSPLATLSGTGNALSLPTTASLGIGTNNPQYKLDVVGDARISNNLLVGGGIITSQTINASVELNAGDVSVANNLNVAGVSHFSGNTIINGSLSLSSLATGSPQPLFVNSSGFLVAGHDWVDPQIGNACNPYSKPWVIGGNTMMGLGYSNLTVGTCDNFDFVLKANSIPRQWIKPDGTISFGTSINSNTGGAEYKFDKGVIRLTSYNTYGGPQIVFDGGANPYGDWGIEYNAGQLAKPGLNFWKPYGSTNSNNNLFFLADDGMVGVGTDNPTTRLTVDAWTDNGFKVLSVNTTTAIEVYNKNTNRPEFKVLANGYVFAREINVQSTLFPDYVFEKDYKLKSLSEVDAFIKQHKHLPGFEKGEYYEKNGINVTELLIQQQQTLEELTLYVIELKKEINELKKKN